MRNKRRDRGSFLGKGILPDGPLFSARITRSKYLVEVRGRANSHLLHPLLLITPEFYNYEQRLFHIRRA